MGGGFGRENLRKEIISNLELGTSIAKLDHLIKNDSKTIQIGQYLPSIKQLITSERIKYHGGYSKKLYRSWNNYVISS
jgi:hypothetical protein